MAGGLSIPAAYFLTPVLGYANAFRAISFIFAAIALAAIIYTPRETKHLALRHNRTDPRAAFCTFILAFLLGAVTGVYGPQVLPQLKERFSVSPFFAVALYTPAIASWLLGPRLAGPNPARVIAGGGLMALALQGMSHAATPYLFSALWTAESLGVAIVSTALDQRLAREVAGVYWGRGYGIYQALNNLGYAIGAAASGYLHDPFIYGFLLSLIFLGATARCSRR